MLAALATSAALGIVFPFAALGLLLLLGLRHEANHTLPNLVTAGRLLLLFVTIVFFREWLAPVAVVAIGLDVLDGWLARRRGSATEFGAMFDMETDAWTIACICLVLFTTERVGVWGLVPGALRYAYVAARVATGSGHNERRSSLGRLYYTGIFGSLIAALLLPEAVAFVPILFAVVFGVASFYPDFAALRIQRVWWVAAGLVTAGFLLFLPRYIANAGHADFTPFFPDEHPHGAYAWNLRSVWEYVKALGLRRANMDMFRVSLEWMVLVVAVAATARARIGVWVRRSAVGLYASLFLFLIYHHSLLYFFNRTPSLSNDVQLALNLGHFVSDILTLKWAAIFALLVLACAAVVTFAWVTLRGLSRLDTTRSVWIGAGVFVAYGVASLVWFGIDRDDPLMQLPTKNVAAALAARPQVTLTDPGYQRFLDAKLEAKPDVYLLLVEAYGEVLLTDEDLRADYELTLQRVDERLAAIGLSRRSSTSTAPVYGGGSWMSIASVQTGIAVRNQSMYDEVTRISGEYPHITRFFSEQGYTTIAVQPGNTRRPGLDRVDPYGRDVVVEAPDLDYDGRPFGWGKIPDQFALGHTADLVLPEIEGPVFLFYMGVTTHAPWDAVPPIVDDWRTLEDRALRSGPIGYLKTIQYEWEALARFIEQVADEDAVFIVLGDHQPALRNRERAATYKAPVHVISGDPEWMDLFADQDELAHEDIYALLVERLL